MVSTLDFESGDPSSNLGGTLSCAGYFFTTYDSKNTPYSLLLTPCSLLLAPYSLLLTPYFFELACFACKSVRFGTYIFSIKTCS